MEWRDEPTPCRGQTPLFFSDERVDQDTAKKVCSECPHRVRCVDLAVRRRESYGVWGGFGPTMREWLRSEMLKGAEQYRAALTQAFDDLDATVGKPGATRPDHEPAVCARCSAPVRPGARPIDRNGPNSTCGIVSTYNKGCRCDPCIEAKRLSDANRHR